MKGFPPLTFLCCYLQQLTIIVSLLFVKNASAQSQLASNQNIWLVNSKSKIVSALDSVIDRRFFDAKPVTINCLTEFPPDVEFECLSYDIDSTKIQLLPKMSARFTGPKLYERLLERMLEAKNEELFLIMVKGDKQEGEYKFFGTMQFRLSGEPRPAKKIEERRIETMWLVNHKGQKKGVKDVAISKVFFKKEVKLKTNTSFGANPNIIVLLQQENEEWASFLCAAPNLSEEVLSTIQKQAIGNKVFIIFQDKTAEGNLLNQVQFEFVLKE